LRGEKAWSQGGFPGRRRGVSIVVTNKVERHIRQDRMFCAGDRVAPEKRNLDRLPRRFIETSNENGG